MNAQFIRARYNQLLEKSRREGPRARPALASQVARMPQAIDRAFEATFTEHEPKAPPPKTAPMADLGSALDAFASSLLATRERDRAQAKPVVTEPPTPDADWPTVEQLSEEHFKVQAVAYKTPWRDQELVLKGSSALWCGLCEKESGDIWKPGPTGREVRSACRCSVLRERAEALSRALIPASLDEATIKKFKRSRLVNSAPAMQTLGRFMTAMKPDATPEEQAEFKGALFAGSTGSGKTHLAAAMLRWAIARGHTGHWVNWPNFCKAVKASWDCDSVTEAQLLSEAVDADVVVLNELRVDFGGTGEWALGLLFDFLERVLNRRCRFIVTTNLMPSEVEKGLDARTASRLKELAPTVEMVGVDSRGLANTPIPGGSPWP